MSGGIETFALIFLAHAQPDRQIDDLVSDRGHDAGPDEGRDHTFELDPELRHHPRIADLAGDPVLDQPGPEKRRVVEHAREQGAEDSADGVDTEDIERIVRASMRFSWFTPQRQTKPAAKPITNAPGMPTLPAAGVIATRPATAPDAAPSIEGLPLKIASPAIQASTAQAVAR